MKNNFDYKIAHLEEILTNDKYKQALKNLKYEEKQILYYLAVEEYSVKELSKKLNLSKRKISRFCYLEQQNRLFYSLIYFFQACVSKSSSFKAQMTSPNGSPLSFFALIRD